MQEITVGSDYSGVGAFDQSLIRLGIPFKKLFACDFDYNARITYVLNFGTEEDLQIALSKEHKMFCDGMEFVILGYSEEKQIDSFEKKCVKLNISGDDLEARKHNFAIAADNFANTFSFYYPLNVYDRQIPEESIDIYMTSPPCQAFSLAGKRLGKSDIKGILFFNSLEFIDKNRPKAFTFENVKGLLSDDKTNKNAQYGNTFQEWINYLGGKSVNGVPTIFPYEDSVPYHIYFKVINAKEFGVPQNRERIFIIGIRDDENNNFQFPKEFPLEKRLKDVLESVVDEKYFLSGAMIKCLLADNEKHKSKGNGFKFECKKPEDIANSITTKAGQRGTDNFLNYDIINNQPTIIEHRGHIEKEPKFIHNGIVPCLRAESHGHESKIIVEEFHIAAIRGRNPINPKSRKSGLETVQMLEINENGVSNALTTVQKDNVVIVISNTKKGFEKAEEEDSINFSNPNSKTRRGRVGKKVAQTLDTACNQGVFTQQRIRRLTPTECFRLMDFNPEMIEKTISSGLISDSQLYKQAGNSICVEPLKLLMEKIYKLITK